MICSESQYETNIWEWKGLTVEERLSETRDRNQNVCLAARAVCGESRTYGSEGGKVREDLPILIGSPS